MPLITTTANETIKRYRALKQRKARDESNLFFVEGIRIVGEAVQLNAQVESLIVAPNLLKSGFANELVDSQERRGVRIVEVSDNVFEALSDKEGPQGIAAVIRQSWLPLTNARIGDELCWVALESAQDPGNIGTIMRTADSVGAGGVILLNNSADPYDPNAIRASMGAVFSLKLVKASFTEFVKWKGTHGYAVIGTSDRGAEDYQIIRYPSPLILLMGSERQGLSPDQMSTCDSMARIPMVGRSDSLNLAVATGVMLYEIFNQKRYSPTS